MSDSSSSAAADVVLHGPDLDATRSKSDKKLYRHITLSNGLKCVLICDTVAMRQRKSLTTGGDHLRSRHDDDDDDDESEDDDSEDDDDEDDDDGSEEEDSDGLRKAATALLVNVGSYHDPPYLQGLSHFLEHMLFLGTEDYPEENAYDKFISSRGGNDNAYTGACVAVSRAFFTFLFVRSTIIDDWASPSNYSLIALSTPPLVPKTSSVPFSSVDDAIVMISSRRQTWNTRCTITAYPRTPRRTCGRRWICSAPSSSARS